MLLIEVVANSMILALTLIVVLVILNRLLQRVVDLSFARTARAEASNLDEQLRQLNSD